MPEVDLVNRSVAGSDAMMRLHLNETTEGLDPVVEHVVVSELSRAHRYPDPGSADLRAAIADRWSLDVAQVVVGNGTDEILLVLALALLGTGRSAVTTDRTFPGYGTASTVSGAKVRQVPLDGYRVDVRAFESALVEPAAVVFLCNPHNPTGTAVGAIDLEWLLAVCEAHGAILVCDEAYAEFDAEDHAFLSHLVAHGRRVVVLRTFSKLYGLAGLRVGYALGPADVMSLLLRAKAALPFSVNRIAQVAATTVVRAGVPVTERRARMLAIRSAVYQRLDELGIEYVPSSTNFVLMRLGVGSSAEITDGLRNQYGILVRDATLFGFPGHIRVSIGTRHEMERFCDALAALVSAH